MALLLNQFSPVGGKGPVDVFISDLKPVHLVNLNPVQAGMNLKQDGPKWSEEP